MESANSIRARFYEHRFTLFLISFLLLLFGELLFPPEYHDQVVSIFLLLNTATSFLLFIEQPRWLRMLALVIIFFVGLTDLLPESVMLGQPLPFAFVYMGYFVMISTRLFHDLKRQRVVGIETISVAFSGFILLSVVSSILFMLLGRYVENAFGGVAYDGDSFPDFLYFSFVTLLTIGYGDIVPTVDISKKLVMLVGLVGNFYSVFVTGIIIGKYLQQRRPTDGDAP